VAYTVSQRAIGLLLARNGQQNLAQGFNPGFNVQCEVPERAPDWVPSLSPSRYPSTHVAYADRVFFSRNLNKPLNPSVSNRTTIPV
jgi:hypothetical protein